MHSTLRIRCLQIVLGCAFALAWASLRAQPGGPSITFSDTDFVNVRLGRMKTTYFVGEPVFYPIRLINHTQFAITILTNTVPGSDLTLRIRPQERRQRDYTGPYKLGGYGKATYQLDPLDELPLPVTIFADKTTTSGLAFPEPGVYVISASLKIEVKESKVSGAIEIPPIQITVEPTPPGQLELVNGLIANQLLDEVQLKLLPADKISETQKLLEGAKPSILTPFVAQAIGNSYAVKWRTDQDNKALADTAIFFLAQAYASTTPFKLQAGLDLLRALSDLKRGPEARLAAQEVLRSMPAVYRGKVGFYFQPEPGKTAPTREEKEKNMFQKYLRNAEEFGPGARYWQIFD